MMEAFVIVQCDSVQEKERIGGWKREREQAKKKYRGHSIHPSLISIFTGTFHQMREKYVIFVFL
jgi:hypothetical protein